LAQVAGKVAEATEQAIWSVSASGSGNFQGLLNQLTAGGSGAVSSSASGSITSANVIADLEALVSAIPDTVYGKEDLTIYIPTNVAKAYQQALGANYANGYNNMVTVGQKPFDYNGIPLFVAPGLPSNYMVAAEKSNLFFGTGLLSDSNEVKVLDMADLDGSQNVRIIMRYTAGVQFGIGSDIAIHKGA
jgi:hypothetical protein